MNKDNRQDPSEDALINPPTAEDCMAMRDRLPPTWRLSRSPDAGDLAWYARVEALLPQGGEPLTKRKLAAIAGSTGLSTGEIYRAVKARVVASLEEGHPDGRWVDARVFIGRVPGASAALPGEARLAEADHLVDNVLAPLFKMDPALATATERGTAWNLQAAAIEGRLELVTRHAWADDSRRLEHLGSAIIAATTAVHVLRNVEQGHPERLDAGNRAARLGGAYLDAAVGALASGRRGRQLRSALIEIAVLVEASPATEPGAYILLAGDALARAR